MPHYGRDYDGRGYPERPGGQARHWPGGRQEGRYDEHMGYRGRNHLEEDRGYGWRSAVRGGGWDEYGDYLHTGPRRYGQVDYRGGYGAAYGPPDQGYGADYGFRNARAGYPPARSRGYRGRPPRDYGPEFGYGLDPAGYGDYGGGRLHGGGLFRGARGGGVAPGRYFRGYGIGSAGGYEPF